MSLKKINQLRPAKFKYTDAQFGSTEKITLGVMAQDIDKIYPEADYSMLTRDENGLYMVEYTQLIAPMIKAIQELSDEIDKIKEQNKDEHNL